MCPADCFTVSEIFKKERKKKILAKFMASLNTNIQFVRPHAHKQSYEWCVEEAGGPVYLFF